MADAIIEFFRDLLNNDILTIFIISMIPIVELRGAIPVAMEMGLAWYEAFGYAFLGSIVVAPILLLILMPVLNAMKKIKGFRGLANAVENLFQSKAESVRKKANKTDSARTEDVIKIIGVFLFVAIPLPLTGVWTGTAVAVFLGLGFWKSMLAVSLGNVSAGLIMTGLSLLFRENLNMFLTIFMAVVLGVLVLNIIYLVVKSKLKAKKNAAQDCKVDAAEGDGGQNSAETAVHSAEKATECSAESSGEAKGASGQNSAKTAVHSAEKATECSTENSGEAENDGIEAATDGGVIRTATDMSNIKDNSEKQQ